MTDCLIRAAGGEIQKYSSSLKSAKTQIAAVDRCEGGLSLLMGEPAAKTIYREKRWRPSVVDPCAARCGPSTLTATSVRTGFHYLDLLKALPDVFVAKFGPTFVTLHPTVPPRLVYNNHFCFIVLDAVEDPRDNLLDMEDRLKHLTPHFYQASIRSFTYRLESELITLISRSSVK